MPESSNSSSVSDAESESSVPEVWSDSESEIESISELTRAGPAIVQLQRVYCLFICIMLPRLV